MTVGVVSNILRVGGYGQTVSDGFVLDAVYYIFGLSCISTYNC